MNAKERLILSLDQNAFKQCSILIETILQEYQTIIDRDYQGYLNHCKRVAACCLILSQDSREDTIRKIAIAVAFHDIGIWTSKTIDYLEPSVKVMLSYLTLHRLLDWQIEITLMITEHHKLTRTKCSEYPLVEYFRQADYADFSLGLLRSNIPRSEFKKLTSQYPNSGFHKTLVCLGLKRFLQKPWSPLPMFKW
ncbi:HD domain-containing protein [Acinetobacter calcoaceticus]|uniref:HD domain-containing protein n=1 Tax=Acinetobacter calcoaceticus TaxID=471 RepID=UPI001E41242C|nr:HD domain-containing protein [Acinetobacter calcoaceticus]UGQ27124.1 HD domain-containing protein [Acinetobacter calcoaceticus]